MTNYQILIEMRDTIIDYFEEERLNIEKALKAYEPKPIQDDDPEIRKMRELEAIKLRHSASEITKYISVIKRMYPSNVQDNSKKK